MEPATSEVPLKVASAGPLGLTAVEDLDEIDYEIQVGRTTVMCTSHWIGSARELVHAAPDVRMPSGLRGRGYIACAAGGLSFSECRDGVWVDTTCIG